MKDQSEQGAERQQERHGYGAEMNATPGVEGRDDVIADNDASKRASGEATSQGGAGVAGIGGAAGGTSNYGGVGLPGAARHLGKGATATGETGEGGHDAGGGMAATTAEGAGGSRLVGGAAAGGKNLAYGTDVTGGDDPAQGSRAPRAAEPTGKPSDYDHHGGLSMAGGSAGSGGGGNAILQEDH